MRLPSVPTLPMMEQLNTAYFDQLWNAPDDHGLANFPLPKAAQRLQTGAIPVNLSVVGLPTTDKVYAVYRVATRVFGRFVSLPANQWINDQAILASSSVSMVAYSSDGRVIPRGLINLYYDPLRSTVLVAIHQVYTLKCIGQSFPDLFMTVYRDTTRSTPITSQMFVVSSTFNAVVSADTVMQSVKQAQAQYPVGTMIFVNGWIYDFSSLPSLAVGDVVEVVCDPDIVGYCDITVDDNQTGYFSTLYGEYREILHVAKRINPNSLIITHDTLTIGVFNTTSKKGVYGHRINPHAVESITHNDFSMSRSVLQAFQNALSAEGIFVRLYVRFATKPQSLRGDVNHLAELYTLTDLEISHQLAGISSHQITEWRADHLEQSSFLDLLYQSVTFTDNAILTKYAQAAGYYDVASKLSQSLYHYTYKGGDVEIKKPARLIGFPCRIMVYADGRKIPQANIKLSDSSNTSFTVNFTDSTYVAVGTKISVYITESGLRVPVAFNPAASAPSITLDNEDYALVKVVSYQTPKQIWGGTTSQGYHTIPISPGDYKTTVNQNGTATYTVSSIHFGDRFYLIPQYGLTVAAYPLDDMLENKKPLVIPLQISDVNSTLLPLIGYQALELYINGYRLIEDIDYTCNSIVGDNDDTLQTLLEISNMEYLAPNVKGNVLEVVVHGDSVASRDRGYVIANKMYRTTPPMIWSASCGRAFVRGRLIHDVQEIGNVLESNTALVDGSPYLLEWSLPYGVAKLMTNISPNSDINLRTRIDGVLGLVVPTYPSTVIITQLFALYSPYLATIISDVANGLLVIIDEPDNSRFLYQFSAYALLYPRDPILGAANDLIDRRFVTLAAHYANFTVQDPQQMVLVQRLIGLLLTPSHLSINEVLV